MAAFQLAFEWDGEAMRPVVPHRREADRRYVIGEIYTLTAEDERSAKSHRHYFAVIRQAWRNLPEHLCDAFPTTEHLRKWALIQTGYRHERMIVCDLASEAERIAAFIQPMDEFAVVMRIDAVVRVWTAKSQSVPAMGAADFQASKDDVLGLLANLLDVTPQQLQRSARIAA